MIVVLAVRPTAERSISGKVLARMKTIAAVDGECERQVAGPGRLPGQVAPQRVQRALAARRKRRDSLQQVAIGAGDRGVDQARIQHGAPVRRSKSARGENRHGSPQPWRGKRERIVVDLLRFSQARRAVLCIGPKTQQAVQDALPSRARQAVTRTADILSSRGMAEEWPRRCRSRRKAAGVEEPMTNGT